MKINPVIQSAGYGISGNIGGIQYRTYWLPDGRQVRAVPIIRDWVKKNEKGEVIGQGTRDANLDKGWLLEKPAVLKYSCLYCARWHDNQTEVDACKVAVEKEREEIRKKTDVDVDAFLKEKQVTKDAQISKLEAQVAKLTSLVEKLMPKEKV